MRYAATSSKKPWATACARVSRDRREARRDRALGHRVRKGEPLYQIRNIMRASRNRPTPRQQERLHAAFAADEAHISVEAVYQLTQL